MLDKFQHAAHTGFTAHGEPPDNWPAQQHRARAKRQRLNNVGAAPYAAIDQHIDLIADGCSNRLQHLGRRRRRIKLTPTVIRNDDPARAVAHSALRVISARHALQQNRQLGLCT